MTDRKSLLLINQFFWPDRAATSQLLGDLAAATAKKGFEVTALAGRGAYSVPSGTQLQPLQEWQGVTIRRVACTRFGRSNILGRVLDYLTYLVSSLVWLMTRKPFDVVVCLSTPPLIATLGALSRRRGSRFVYKVEDLYPDVAIELGALRSGSILSKVLERVSSRLLESADDCVALDHAMSERIRQRGAQSVSVIPNWADGEAIRPDPESGVGFRKAQGLGSQLRILYSGNLGNAHRFDAVCEAIRQLSDLDIEAQFLFVGAGPRLSEVRDALRGLDTVQFMPYQPRETLGGLYNAADIHLVTLRDEVAGMLVPSKFAAALAAGKPVLLVGGQGADLFKEVTSEDVGWACDHEPARIVEILTEVAAGRSLVEEKGIRARSLFEKKYSKTKAMANWLRLLGEQVRS